MKRMLRLDKPGSVGAKEDSELTFEDYSYEELESLRNIISKEIERREQVQDGKAEIHWEALFVDHSVSSVTPSSGPFGPVFEARPKKPYLAILVPDEVRRYDYQFLKLSREYVKSDGSEIKFVYNGYLPIGKVLRGRIVPGEEFYYKVVPSGLKVIYEMEAVRMLEQMKKEQMKGEQK